MDVLIRSCAGLDEHLEKIAGSVLTGIHEDGMHQENETCPTLAKDLFHLLK